MRTDQQLYNYATGETLDPSETDWELLRLFDLFANKGVLAQTGGYLDQSHLYWDIMYEFLSLQSKEK